MKEISSKGKEARERIISKIVFDESSWSFVGFVNAIWEHIKIIILFIYMVILPAYAIGILVVSFTGEGKSGLYISIAITLFFWFFLLDWFLKLPKSK